MPFTMLVTGRLWSFSILHSPNQLDHVIYSCTFFENSQHASKLNCTKLLVTNRAFFLSRMKYLKSRYETFFWFIPFVCILHSMNKLNAFSTEPCLECRLLIFFILFYFRKVFWHQTKVGGYIFHSLPFTYNIG